MMVSNKVFLWNAYRVVLTNRDESVIVCAPHFTSAIEKVIKLIDQWDDKDLYSIISITHISPCLI